MQLPIQSKARNVQQWIQQDRPHTWWRYQARCSLWGRFLRDLCSRLMQCLSQFVRRWQLSINQSFNSSIWGPLRCRVGLRRILLWKEARYLKWRKLSWQSSSCPLSEKTSPIDYSNEEENCLHLKNYLKIYDPGLYVKMEGHLHSKVGRHFKSKQVSIAVAIVNT